MLIVLRPNGPHKAAVLTNIEAYAASAGTRHKIDPGKSLEDILPTSADQKMLQENSILHVAKMLVEEVHAFARFRSAIPAFSDPKALLPRVSERYYLPTFDQEQGSTRGNMIVLRHYFVDVLKLPQSAFERTMFFVLGDRLTTVRDRAAQDQRSVDRSSHRLDHLSSITPLNGLMHFCMNKMISTGKNMWGTAAPNDVSLLAFRNALPNRTNVNMQKHDFYAWLRFLDTVLRGLVVTSALVAMGISRDELEGRAARMEVTDFMALAKQIVDRNVLPSIDTLEELGIKTTAGSTRCGNAVLMMFDLILLREMRDAIKFAHPTRILRVVKFWAPMFYAGNSYNYSHESMELLHNVYHDWPREAVDTLIGAMTVNTNGEEDGNKECDLDVEHLNKRIKARTSDPSVTSRMLSEISPSLGVIRETADKLFADLHIDEINEHHAKVRQHKDVELIVAHSLAANLFDFSKDTASENTFIDQYRTGIHRLSGKTGGHARHLAKHQLRMRTRHGTETDTFVTPAEIGAEMQYLLMRDENDAADKDPVQLILNDDVDICDEDGF
jgi:hypothetical protein